VTSSQQSEQRSALTYILAIILQRGSLFLFLPILLSHLSVAEYGTFGLLQSAMTLLPTLLTLNLPAIVTRLYFDSATERGRQGRAGRLIVLALVLGTCACLASSLIAAHYRSYLATVLELPASEALCATVLVLWGALGSALLQMSYGVWRAQHRAPRAAAANVLNALAFLAVGGALALTGRLGVLSATAAYAGSALAVGLAASLSAISWSHLREGPEMQVLFREALQYGLPFVPYILGIWALWAGGRWIGRATLSLDEVGQFTLASQLAIMVGLVGRAAYEAWAPRSYALLAEGRIADSRAYLRNRGRVTVLVTGALACAIALGIPLFVPRLFPAYGAVVWLFPLLAVAPVFDVAHLRPHVELVGMKRTGPIGVYTTFSVVLFLSGGFFGARVAGIWGLSGAYVFAHFAQWLAATLVARREPREDQ
jgi:O-antigen/teichoic acid export membrane protein